MLSSNLALRKRYFAELSNIVYDSVQVPVFFSMLPTSIAPGLYITFGQIRNVDDSNKSASVTKTSVTVSVYTNSLKYNDGVAVEAVANEVLNRIYKNPQFKILTDSFFQVIGTELTGDMTNDYSTNQNVYIDRILIFEHTIFQNVS